MEKDRITMGQAYRGMAIGNGDIFRLPYEGSALSYALTNVVILGILFGLSNLLGITLSGQQEVPLSGQYALIVPLLFSIFGILTMFIALIGMTLIYWAAARAFGGPGGLGICFQLIGLAAIPFWILSPLLNYALRYSSASGRFVLLALMIPPFLWSFKVMRQSLVTGQGISENKATIAVAAMWIFCVSAIYAFMPQ